MPRVGEYVLGCLKSILQFAHVLCVLIASYLLSNENGMAHKTVNYVILSLVFGMLASDLHQETVQENQVSSRMNSINLFRPSFCSYIFHGMIMTDGYPNFCANFIILLFLKIL